MTCEGQWSGSTGARGTALSNGSADFLAQEEMDRMEVRAICYTRSRPLIYIAAITRLDLKTVPFLRPSIPTLP